MAPEYGATCGFFPVDEESLKYMKLTGRKDDHIELVKEYLQQNNMFFDVEKEDPEYTDVIDLDLSTVEASLSGPKRPQDLIFLSDMKTEFEKSVTAPAGNQGHGLDDSEFDKKQKLNSMMVQLQQWKLVTLQLLQLHLVQIRLTLTLC